MTELYALREYWNIRALKSGGMSDRHPFKDLYDLLDFVKTHQVVEKAYSELQSVGKVYACVHYPDKESEGKIISYYQ